MAVVKCLQDIEVNISKSTIFKFIKVNLALY